MYRDQYYIRVYWDYIGVRRGAWKNPYLGFRGIAPTVENQLEKNMENKMESGVVSCFIGFNLLPLSSKIPPHSTPPPMFFNAPVLDYNFTVGA